MAVSCYIYGAPRTGNHAFANELVQQVPDTWAVINDQDLGAHQACCYCRGLDRRVAAHFDLALFAGAPALAVQSLACMLAPVPLTPCLHLAATNRAMQWPKPASFCSCSSAAATWC